MCRWLPSFAGAVFVHGHCFRSWVVTFVGGWSSSPSLVGGHAFGVVLPFVWCHGGRSVRLWVVVIAGGRAVDGVQCWGVGGVWWWWEVGVWWWGVGGVC